MSNNDKKEPVHIRIYRIITYILVIGVFLLIAAPIAGREETFGSVIFRLFIAGIATLLVWLRMKKAADEAANAWENLPSSFNRLFNRTKISHNCPQCKSPLPHRRFPTSLNQLWWGGWTCKQCGCEVDSSGREIISR
jgi:hypothetical protein